MILLKAEKILDLMGKIAQGVYVITAKEGEKRNGMTAAWVSRVSHYPPLLMVAVGKKRFSYEFIPKAKSFAVHVMGRGNIETAKHFGFSSGKSKDKFGGIEFKDGKTGSPILKDCVAYFDCEMVNNFEAGDHNLFVGKVIDAKLMSDEESLVFSRKDF